MTNIEKPTISLDSLLKTQEQLLQVSPLSKEYDPKKAQLLDVVNFDDVYKYAGNQIGYVSRYPEYATWRDNEDFYAKQQTGLDKLVNSSKTLWTLGKGSFVQQMTEIPIMIQALASGDRSVLHENKFAQGLAQQMTAAQDLNPIYETNEQQRLRDLSSDEVLGNAWLSLKQYVPGTGRAGNAWANLTGQLGFTLGTIAYLGAETAILGAATSHIGGAAGWAKLPMNIQKTLKSIKNFQAVDQTRKLQSFAQGRQMIQTGAALRDYTNIGIRGVQSLRSALAEGGLEGAMNANEHREKAIQEIIASGRNPTVEEVLKIEQEAKKLGNSVTTWNVPILMLSNEMLFGRFFHRGSFGAIKNTLTDQIGLMRQGDKLLAKTTKEIAKAQGTKGLAKYYGKKGVDFVKGGLSEGWEEVAQGTVGDMAKRSIELAESGESAGFFTQVGLFGDALAESMQTREGWDEFWAGYLTGIPISTLGGVKSRLTGETKSEERRVQQGIKEIQNAIDKLPSDFQTLANANFNPSANNSFRNMLTTYMSSMYAIDAENKGQVKRANDFDRENEANFFYTMMKYGMLDDTVKEMAETMRELEEQDPEEFALRMGDKKIEQVTEKLLERGKEYEKVFDRIDKRIVNPYDRSSEFHKWTAYEQAKRAYTDLNYYAFDSIQRTNEIKRKIQSDGVLKNEILEVLTDPSKLDESIVRLEQSIESSKLALEPVDSEISRKEQELAVLKGIREKTFKKDGDFRSGKDYQDIIKDVVKGLGLESKTTPEMLQDLIDLIELEDESVILRHIVNSLDSEEYFNKFADKWLSTVLTSKSMQALDPQRTPESVAEERKQEIASTPINELKEQLDESLANRQGDGVEVVISDKKESLEQAQRNPDGSFERDGKTYETFEALVNDVVDQDQNLTEQEKELLKPILISDNANLADPITNIQDTAEQAQGEIYPPNTVDEARKEAERGSQFFSTSISAVLAHYYDYVVTKVWGDQGKTVVGKWLGVLDPETVQTEYQKKKAREVSNAVENFGDNYNVVTIHLSDPEKILGGLAKDFNEKDTQVQAVIDENSGRLFLFVDGNANTVDVVNQVLGLQVSITKSGFQVLKDNNGNPIQSKYKESMLNKENRQALNKLKKGDSVELRLEDTDFNRRLKQKFDTKEVTEEEFYDSVEIGVYSQGKLIGVLRISDFLFDTKEKSETTKAFRTSLQNTAKAKQLNTSLGFVKFVAPNTSRGFNVDPQSGEGNSMSIEEFKPLAEAEGHSVEIFTATSETELENESGTKVDGSEFDRGNFKTGRKYMRVTTADGHVHTVGLFKEDGSDQDFTNLDPKLPIISKRAILDLSEAISPTRLSTTQRQELQDNIEQEISENNGEITVTQTNDTPITLVNSKVENGMLVGTLKDDLDTPTDLEVGSRVVARDTESNEIEAEGTIVALQEDGVSIKYEVEEGKTTETFFPYDNTVFEPASPRVLSFILEDLNEVIPTEKVEEEVLAEVEVNPFPKDGTKSEKETWVQEFGTEGVVYEITPKHKIKVTERAEDSTTIEESISGIRTIYVAKNGKKTYKSGEGISNTQLQNPSEELLLRTYERSLQGTVGFRERQLLMKHGDRVQAIIKRNKNRNTKADKARANMPSMENFKHFFMMLGENGEQVLFSLYDTYRASVNAGTPIKYITDLIEATPLTSSQRLVLESYMNNANGILLWSYVTQADIVKGLRRNDAFRPFLDINEKREALNTLNSQIQEADEDTPAVRKALNERIFVENESTGIAFPNLQELTNLQFVSYKMLVEAFTQVMNTTNENIVLPVQNLIRLATELDVTILTDPIKTFNLTRVARASMGRELFYPEQVSMVAEVNLLNEGRVFNEQDGLIVNVPENITFDENTSLEIWKLQKLFLSLGLEVSEEGLAKYNHINGKFDALKTRVLQQLKAHQAMENQEIAFVTDEDVLLSGKLLIGNINTPRVMYNNDVYMNVVSGTPSYYVKVGDYMTAEDISKLLNKTGVKQERLVQSVEALKEVKRTSKNKKTKITC